MVFGDRGTGKSTAVRALAALLPPLVAVKGCAYHRDPKADAWFEPDGAVSGKRSKRLTTELVPTPVVDLPLGATEDRGGRRARPGARSDQGRKAV